MAPEIIEKAGYLRGHGSLEAVYLRHVQNRLYRNDSVERQRRSCRFKLHAKPLVGEGEDARHGWAGGCSDCETLRVGDGHRWPVGDQVKGDLARAPIGVGQNNVLATTNRHLLVVRQMLRFALWMPKARSGSQTSRTPTVRLDAGNRAEKDLPIGTSKN